uniref:Putative zinc finger, CCHC-type n=1 Tax=Tanacetum cinerariifolium TaxID=118510 RepID=A0A699HB62_TANCI|nr:putative zinc finger, CCHC-type [Tanacetum cinerariifolium]
MVEPLSPNHVFDFLEDDPALNEEEFEAEPKEDPEKEPEDAQEMDVDVEVGLDDEAKIATSAMVGTATQVPFTRRRFPGIYAPGGSSSDALVVYHPKDVVPGTMIREIDSLHENKRLKRIGICWDKQYFYSTMPPERLKRRAIERLVKNQVAEDIAKYERNRANNPENVRGTRPVNARRNKAPELHGCSYKTFLNCKPYSFNGTEGVVGLSQWLEKMKSVFEINKC